MKDNILKEPTQALNSSKLKGWQLAVVDAIKGHDDYVGTETLQSIADHMVNRYASVRVKFPKGSGHTYLAGYIAAKFPTAYVYFDQKQYKQIEGYKETFDTGPKQNTSLAVSFFELDYAVRYSTIQNSAKEPIISLDEMKEKLIGKRVIVVDGASKLSPLVEDFILNVAQGIVVFLD